MTDKTTKQIADKLKQVRVEKGFTQATLSEKAGINVNYYAKVERGEAAPTAPILEKLVKALGVKSSDIFPF